MLVLAVLEFGLELGLLSFRSPLPFALLNTSGSLQYSPRSAAPRRGASAGINTAVLSQKRLERLMVGVPRYGSTQQYCLIFWLIRLP